MSLLCASVSPRAKRKIKRLAHSDEFLKTAVEVFKWKISQKTLKLFWNSVTKCPSPLCWLLSVLCIWNARLCTPHSPPSPSSYLGDFGALRATVCPSDLVCLICSLTPSHHERTCSPALSCNTTHIIQMLWDATQDERNFTGVNKTERLLQHKGKPQKCLGVATNQSRPSCPAPPISKTPFC